MSAENKTLTAALWFIEHGYSVIPISPKSKVPPKGFKVEEFRKRLATPEEVRQWFNVEPYYNLAMITGELSGACVVDLDSHKPNYDPAIAYDYFSEHDGPVSVTPRLGNHLYYKFPTGLKLTINAGALPGIDFRGEGGYILVPPSSNGTGNPYAWVEKKAIGELPLKELPDAYINLLTSANNNIYSRGGGRDSNPLSSSSLVLSSSSLNQPLFTEGQRNDHIFHLAHSMLKGGSPQDFVLKTVKLIGRICQPPVSDNELMKTFESACQRSAKKEQVVMDEVRDFIMSTTGSFLIADVCHSLQLHTRIDRKNVSICLKRAVKEGLIVKDGKKSGQYRAVDTDEEIIDWQNAEMTPLDVKLPMDVHTKVNIHRGNIIVIAGESNSGKTAMCLSTALMNKDKFVVNYLSSEMSDGAELRIRLEQFEEGPSAFKDIKFQFRTDDFPDKIDPDGLNIIDYLDEGSEEAYKMGLRIRQIADKLKGGIAIIAIQKPPNRDFGLGGSGTLNRARLYLSISPGTLLITKGKIWATDTNPNGMYCHFKLLKGCRFTYDIGGGWDPINKRKVYKPKT